MTHDKYKAALDEINRIFYYEFPVWVSIYKEPKLSDKLMYTIRHALTIAAEYESLRRENEELKAKLDKANWQPIETAPKDGKSILVTDGFEVCDAYFRGGDWWQYECGDDWYSTSINPTHWMPLPDAPEQR